ALLTSLQVGFKTVAIEQKSSEIMKLLIVFKTEFKKFNELLEKTKKKIDEASDTIEQATRKTKSIAKRLDNVETKGLISGEEYNEI
ncbi:MAG: DNA recombination protein RmuC, partial [Clostridia bacterium]|nr:DNA recombination protein RmuC [Clostridia bacterium]